jgi:hypothetical protein
VEEESGRYLSRRGFICAAVSVGDLFLKEHASSSARTCVVSIEPTSLCAFPTSQAIYGPLFELFERDVRGWRDDIEIQPTLVLKILVGWSRKLFRSMIETRSPLGINSRKVLPDHDCGALW